jgi:hypothetical protein
MTRAATMKKIQLYLTEEDDVVAANQTAEEQDALDVAANVASSKAQVQANLDAAKAAKQAEIDQAKQEKALKEQGRADVVQAQRAVKFATSTYTTLHKNVTETADKVVDTAQSAWETLGNIATPGSIFLPISVLLIFFFLVFPVNGNTRMEWLFLTLTGNAKITGAN